MKSESMLPKQLKSNQQCQYLRFCEVYIKQTFVHKAQNKEMKRWASENDIIEHFEPLV